MKNNIIEVEPNGKLFDSILKLWRVHSDTLGFMPEGGFSEHAAKKHLLAIMHGAELGGYIMYRVANERASIVHLCVRENFRGKGLSRILIGNLIEKSKHLSGIALRCRVDFVANDIWPKLGFIPIYERTGRSHTGEQLIYWWYDHGQPNLFTREKNETALLKVALDANVVFDLDPSNLERQEESQALVSDWLADYIELCVTDEMYVEVNRQKDDQQRRRSRSFLQNFKVLHGASREIDTISAELCTILPPSTTRDKSDVKQVAKAIVSGVTIFVTRDERLLGAAGRIFDDFEIKIIRPAQFVIDFDSIKRHKVYQSTSLAGTKIQLERPKEIDADAWIAVVLNSQSGEKKTELKRLILKLVSQPQTSEVYSVKDAEDRIVGLFAITKSKGYQIQVPLLRLRDGITAKLTQYLLMLLSIKCIEHSAMGIRISDKHLPVAIRKYVETEYRQLDSTEWFRVNIAGIGSAARLSTRLELLSQDSKYPIERLNPKQHLLRAGIDPATALELEKAVWPFRLTDSDLPTYIVSIQPRWAKHLVDYRLIDSDLFGADIKLAMNRNSIYYRSARKNISGPARILWYVSGLGELRACSLLDDTVTGEAKSVFRQFKSDGVYLWHHLADLTKGKADTPIMALRFSETELFDKPIKRDRLLQLLSRAGINTLLLSPTKVSNAAFATIYSEASGRDIEH
jgi:predicted nucleic acid-binding protein